MNYDGRRSPLDVHPMNAPLGAEVRGIDLAVPLTDETVAAIEQALYRHIVLVFRDQKIDEPQQLAFCSRFGELYTNPNGGKTRMVSNQLQHLPKDQLHDTEMSFHHDTIFRPVPQKALCMVALTLPKQGGNTIFANMYAAYDALSEAMKARIRPLTALSAFAYTRTAKMDLAAIDKAPHASHPVAITHPASGRKTLYVDPLMTLKINELDAAEGDALLDELCAHAESKAFQYEHVWRAGDVVLWDNLASMHARTEMSSEPRVIRHSSILGTVAPTAA